MIFRCRPAFGLLFVASMLSASAAHAHIGGIIGRADFCHPAQLEETVGDAGVVYSYVPEDADKEYLFGWADGDLDPTGNFTFYYLDQQVPLPVTPKHIQENAAIVKLVGGREARNIFAACSCAREDAGTGLCDAGVALNCVDGGARWCDNQLTWDTSGVAPGVYWIAAVNDDPPYFVYNMAVAPVRISHGMGAAKPPVVIVTRPDGIGPGADQSYRIEAIIVGDGPLTVDLAYGIGNSDRVHEPLRRIAKDIPVKIGAKGVFEYEWDVANLEKGLYFINATVRDQMGGVTSSSSRWLLSVFHRSKQDLAVPDLKMAGMEPPPDNGSCSLSRGRTRTGTGPAAAIPCLIGLLLVGRIAARRRRRSQLARRSWSIAAVD